MIIVLVTSFVFIINRKKRNRAIVIHSALAQTLGVPYVDGSKGWNSGDDELYLKQIIEGSSDWQKMYSMLEKLGGSTVAITKCICST